MTNKRTPNFSEEVIGWWITHEDYHPNLRYSCNICGNLTKERAPYCPCCKSKMEDDTPDDDIIRTPMFKVVKWDSYCSDWTPKEDLTNE